MKHLPGSNAVAVPSGGVAHGAVLDRTAHCTVNMWIKASIDNRHADEKQRPSLKKMIISEPSVDLGTSGLWALHASTAPL